MASDPVSKYSYSVKEFDELQGLTDTIFGGEACGMYLKGTALISLLQFSPYTLIALVGLASY